MHTRIAPPMSPDRSVSLGALSPPSSVLVASAWPWAGGGSGPRASQSVALLLPPPPPRKWRKGAAAGSAGVSSRAAAVLASLALKTDRRPAEEKRGEEERRDEKRRSPPARLLPPSSLLQPVGLLAAMGSRALAGVVLFALATTFVSADEDCKWYMDKNGSLHHGFDCHFPFFCCGDCYHRFCCTDLRRLITERQQKHCMAFNPRTIAGIASAVILFVAIVATIVCCFLCSCCYLYQRRHHIQTPYQAPGQDIPLSGYPPQPPGPYPMDPKAGPAPFQPGYAPVAGYPPAVPTAQYPLYPPGPPYYNPSAPPPYLPPQMSQAST